MFDCSKECRSMIIKKNHKDNLMYERDMVSLSSSGMRFLLEDVDRSQYEKALQYIEPLSELEDIFTKLPITQAAIRNVISRVNKAMASDPDPIIAAIGLDNSQKELVNACTAAEVLKLSLLNAFDSVRQLIITDFKKTIKFYDDNAIELSVINSSRRNEFDVINPRSVPFSTINGLGSYNTYWNSPHQMIIGAESNGTHAKGTWRIPRVSSSITIDHIPVGKVYLVKREGGDPAPVDEFIKGQILNIVPPPRGNLDKTIKDLSDNLEKKFNIEQVVKRNLKVPAPTVGFIESIYRRIGDRPAVSPTTIPAAQLSTELGELTLSEFKEYFNALVKRTTTSTGDITTIDIADTLVLGGLAYIGGLLGISKPASTTPTAAAGTTSAPGTSAAATPGVLPAASRDGRPAGESSVGVPRHSLSSILGRPSIINSANRDAVLRGINQDALRRELNSLVGGSTIFTEGTVNRWTELAGIKEIK